MSPANANANERREGPRVSVVIATYNRSNVLSLAIASVLSQTIPDWEIVVVGDACTDDTAAVVAAFRDPRIQFVNLDRNCGEQSGPNNEGLRLARGRFAAFLNQDDLWLPDHLEAALAPLEAGEADLVFTLTETIDPEGRSLTGAAPAGEYRPFVICPASSWVFRRDLSREVGPWKNFREIYDLPSVEWLRRAFREGKRLRSVPRMTVVRYPSVSRRNSYSERQSAEQVACAARMRSEPDFRERELTALAIDLAARDPLFRQNLRVLPYLSRGLKNALVRGAVALGFSPNEVYGRLMLRGRGGTIDTARKRRGLPPAARGLSPAAPDLPPAAPREPRHS